jgi:hypothetical protein
VLARTLDADDFAVHGRPFDSDCEGSCRLQFRAVRSVSPEPTSVRMMYG